MNSTIISLLISLGPYVGLGVFMLGLTTMQLVFALREKAKEIAMGEIPKIEDENPDKSGEDKMDLVLSAIWLRFKIPAALIPAIDIVFGKIVEDSAQYIYDKYYSQDLSHKNNPSQ